MKLDNGGLIEIAKRLRESRKILEKTHYRISQSLDGLETLHETIEKATRVLQKSFVRP